MFRTLFAYVVNFVALVFVVVAILSVPMGSPQLVPVYLTVPAVVFGAQIWRGYRSSHAEGAP